MAYKAIPSDPSSRSRRKPPRREDRTLSDKARTLFAGMPHAVRPRSLMRSYPRAANAIAARWETPAIALRHFRGLLIDERGDRDGFPVEVARELCALHHYYVTEVFPPELDIWKSLDRRTLDPYC